LSANEHPAARRTQPVESGPGLLAHVQASAALLGLELETARAQRVALQLENTAAQARLLEQLPLAPDDEPAETYCPKRPVPPAGLN
jgi:hypothetical protein